MRYIYLSILLLSCLLPGSAPGQNLVPNPSFENYTNCPSFLSSIPFTSDYTNFQSVLSWTNPCRESSPDYFHSCATTTSGLQVPKTTFGFQQPVSWNAYAGLIAFQGDYSNGTLVYDYREYLQTRLLQPLAAGKIYCVSFYVSPTISPAFNLNYVGIDEIGIDFSVNRPLDTVAKVMTLSYDIKSTPGVYFTDTSKWYKVTGNYLATGGEEWLTLGTFKNGTGGPAFTPVYPAVPGSGVLHWTYLFIDDVTVREIKAADTMTATHDTVVCKATGLNIDLAATNGVGYQWNNGATGGTITVSDTGKYWCTSMQECGLASDTFFIRYQPYNILNLGKDTTNCNSQPVPIGTNNVYSNYLWNTGAVTNTITASQSGTYILMVSDTCGVQRDTIEVAVQPPTPAPVADDTVICQNTMAPLLNVQGANIRWYPLNGTIGVSKQPFISTRDIGTQTLYLTQTIGKCESPRVPVNVTVKYTPKADIGDFMTVCAGSDTIIGHPYPEVTYLWNTNEMVCCIKPRQTGKYQLTISNSCGTSTDTAFVEIYPCDECMFLPTAFTPNGDGLNDDYRPIMKCAVDNYKLTIYNRWGELIFRSEDINKGWNGLYNGNTSDAGSYVYLMEYRSSVTGTRKSLKGNVTLIR